MKRLDKLKRKSKEDKSDAPSCSSARPPGSTQPMPSKSDEDVYDEAFFKELDDIMKKFCEMKNKTVDEYPKFDLLSQSPKVEEQNEVEVEGYEEHNEAEDVVVQNASEEKFAEEDDGRYTLEQRVHFKAEKFDKGVNVCVIDPMSCLAHDDMSISNDAPFKSKFMSRNGRYLHHDKAMMTE